MTDTDNTTEPTSEQIEAAAKAMFELPATGDYTWAEMVAEDPSRADLWREDARSVLLAALASRPPVPVTPAPTPEWEYGYTSKWGTNPCERELAERRAEALRKSIASGNESGDLEYHGKLRRRRPEVPAGPWLPVPAPETKEQ